MRVTQTAIRNVATIAFLAAVGCGGTGPAGPVGPPGATGATGATGETGATGAAGGGYYVDRDDAYCNAVVMAPTDNTVFAECNTPQDLPLTGSCEKGVNINAVLDLNGPSNWDPVDTNFGARWVCAWSVNGATTHIDGASATICCVTHP